MSWRLLAALVLLLPIACDKGSGGSESPDLVTVGPEPSPIPGAGAAPEGGDEAAEEEVAEEPPKPEIDTEIATEGSMSPADIATALDAHMGDIHACYQEAIKRTFNEDLAGVVVVNFVVGSGGKVNGAAVTEENLGDQIAIECIVGVVAGSQLPAPSDGEPVRVRFPVELGM
jgi:hypothetical protein